MLNLSYPVVIFHLTFIFIFILSHINSIDSVLWHVWPLNIRSTLTHILNATKQKNKRKKQKKLIFYGRLLPFFRPLSSNNMMTFLTIKWWVIYIYVCVREYVCGQQQQVPLVIVKSRLFVWIQFTLRFILIRTNK